MPRRVLVLALFAGAALLAVIVAGGGGDEAQTGAPAPQERADANGGGDGPPAFRPIAGVTTAGAFTEFGDDDLERWREDVPDAEDIRIPSTADGEQQPALWLPPSGEGDRPLLVVLHSWSTGYRQHLGIPFARWAQREGWAFIAPDFRGVNETRQSTGSDLAVQDTVDAIDHAIEQGGVDRDRVFVVGFSGGGMSALLMAGRHPDRLAGAVAWVPIHDLNDWYEHNVAEQPERAYDEQIRTACGGDPRRSDGARRSCERRSPVDHLDAAREAGLPVYIGHGLDDPNVPPDHGVRAFNQLAGEQDRLPRDFERRVADNRLPDWARGTLQTETFFREGDPDVLFARRSGDTTLVLFDGEHDMVFNPGLEWMARLAAR